ncbi:SusD/RagB family nutrient-binding outer membrane lipoprotein [Tenacibaculum sp. IB213877]|uniref:SusD/RagB family nutrient-binding outer membrane lipoprotein n=1 Tax=Tenacibaculum sp. IB213877 TaxID=3097351 RepID=UPI002A5A9F7F|nr:SusD/RagB family nutrient-binding outer membrane lipoprotein [Tenacibaculum sp. IB213877]MDY0780081.1 SusD/RagB family nutrient-binding outer membrane lipoprotein [Tenacibaculum sp. IB213877]
MKINKIILAIMVVAQLFTITSCNNDFEEVNTNPNDPSAVPASLLLASVIYNAGDQVQSPFLAGEAGSCWVQHLGKPVYNDNELYIPRQNSIENLWSILYSRVLKDADVMQQLAAEEGNSNLQGVALVMKAYAYQVLTDAFGNIPMSEALKGDQGIITPVYDDSETQVYPTLLSMLDNAMTLLNGNGDIDPSQDLLYAGDYTKWKKFAASLKFRVLMRASSSNNPALGNIPAQLSALVNSGNLFGSNDDEAKLVYLGAEPNANPYFEGIVNGGRTNEWCLGEELVEFMKSTGDTRLPVYAQEVGGNGSGNGYVGKPAGIEDIANSPFGDSNNVSLIGEAYLEATAPAYFMSNAQLKLLMAEAAEKGYIATPVDAATFFNEGVAASCAANGVATFPITYNGGAAGLQQIAEQSWVALYMQGFEAFAEWRRTGIPNLPLAQDAVESSIPSRFNYPISQQSVNGLNYTDAVSAQGTDNLTTSLWWQ